MIWRVATSVTIAALLSWVAGCSSAPKIEPHGEALIQATADETRVAATVHLLNAVNIQLPPLKVAGTQWVLVYNDERFLQPTARLTPTPDGGAKMQFLAVRAGRRIVRFFALPPGKEVVPTQTCELVIEILGPGDA